MAAAWQALARRDKAVAAVIRKVGPCPLEASRKSPYEALVSAIAHQQLHGTAARAILARLAALGGGGTLPAAEALLAHPEDGLRAAGLSQAKLLAIRDVAARTLDGTVPTLEALETMADEEIIERLTTVRGVGRWTAQMLLISTLGRPDVMPADDFGVRLGFQWTYGLSEMPKPRALIEATEQFAPYRSTLSLYFWRYVDLCRAEAAAQSAVRTRPPAAPRNLKKKAVRAGPRRTRAT